MKISEFKKEIEKIQVYLQIFLFVSSNEEIQENLILIFSSVIESLYSWSKKEINQEKLDALMIQIEAFDFLEGNFQTPSVVLDMFFEVLNLYDEESIYEFTNWKLIEFLCGVIEVEKEKKMNHTNGTLFSLLQKIQLQINRPNNKSKFSEHLQIKLEGKDFYLKNKNFFLFNFLIRNTQKIQFENLTGPELLQENYDKLRYCIDSTHFALSPAEMAIIEESLNPKSSKETIKNILIKSSFVIRNKQKTIRWFYNEALGSKKILNRVDSQLLKEVFNEKIQNFTINFDQFDTALERVQIAFNSLILIAIELQTTSLFKEYIETFLNKAKQLFSNIEISIIEKENWDKKVYELFHRSLIGWNSKDAWIYPVLRDFLNILIPENRQIHVSIGCYLNWEIQPRLRLKYLFYRNSFPNVFGFKILEVEKTGHSLNLDQIISIFQ